MKKKYIQLTSAVITLLFLGIAYAWSLFVGTVQAEYPEWSGTALSFVFTLCMVCFCSASMVSGKIVRKIGKKKLFLVCAVCYLVGMIGAGNAHQVWHLYLCYGVLCGSATGLSYNCLISTVTGWFPQKPGMASGILMMGFGMGGLILGATITALHEELGWRKTFFLLAVVYCGLMVYQAFFLRSAPEKAGHTASRIPSGRCGELSLAESLHTKPIWFYYIWGCMLATIGFGVIGHISQTALQVESAAFFAVLATGTLSVSNGVSRVIFGVIYDQWGRKTAMWLINGFILVGVLLIGIALVLQSPGIILFGALCIGLGYGGSVSCNSAYAREYYGEKYFAENFGFISSDGLLSAFLGPTIMSVLEHITGDYLYAYISMLLFCGMMWIMESKISREEDKPFFPSFKNENHIC